MFWIKLFVVAAWLIAVTPTAMAQNASPASQGTVSEFKLTDGNVLKGELASANADGFLIKLSTGGFSERYPWTKMSQETIKLLQNHPQAGQWVRPFIEVPMEEKIQTKVRKPVQRSNYATKPVATKVDLAPEKSELSNTITQPLIFAVVLLLFAANIYAGYEVSVYRGRPAALVCGVSLVLPVAGPLIFLALPSEERQVSSGTTSGPNHEVGAPPSLAAAGVPSGSSLNIAKGGGNPATGGGYIPAVYNHSDTQIDRRFFETKFTGFFRVVAGEAEKNVVLTIKTMKNEYVVRRIARITSNEMHVQLQQASVGDISVQFSEIIQVSVKEK
jgi:hypothetical protein